MYSDTIKAENKIISNDNLTQIFQLMGETLKKYKKISEREEIQNRVLNYRYQNYTFKDSGSRMKVVVDFYDNTNITFDSYENFMSVFYSRLEEIKIMDIYYSLYYSVVTPEPNRSNNLYSQTIQMQITENKMNIMLNLKSEDPKLNEIYNLIKDTVLNAPEKYDEIIIKRSKITNTIALATGFIPGIIISTLFLFIPVLNTFFFRGYIVYPICAMFFTYLIGSMIATTKLDKYYNPIVPAKKSEGYDSNFNRIYKDDIESFIGTSEILIGKKANNLDNRRIIKNEYDKYKNLIPKELLVLLIATIVVIIIGLFI